MTSVRIPKIPRHFYTILHPLRWADELATNDGEERMILSAQEILIKGRREAAYVQWLRKHGLPPRQCRFQAIQILAAKYGDTSPRDWWPPYRDCIFRVFVNPYNEHSGLQHRQWYILCPEDCEMINRFEADEQGRHYPPRQIGERFISRQKELRKVKLVPVECCRHWRHETTGGVLPEGL